MRKNLFSLLCCICISATLLGQCYTDRHSTTWSDAWISCDPAPNPNPARSASHWIRYQLGAEYGLGQMHFWNYNEPNKTNQGIQDIVIDYTTDGVNWIEWGTYTIPQSDGSAFYEGIEGPDLMIQATEVLISAVNNYGGECYALSEVKIDVTEISIDDNVLVSDFSVEILPNPADVAFQFIVDFENATALNYFLIDINGQYIFSSSKSLSPGKQSISINTASLPAGEYILELQAEDKRTSKKISVFHQ